MDVAGFKFMGSLLIAEGSPEDPIRYVDELSLLDRGKLLKLEDVEVINPDEDG